MNAGIRNVIKDRCVRYEWHLKMIDIGEGRLEVHLISLRGFNGAGRQ